MSDKAPNTESSSPDPKQSRPVDALSRFLEARRAMFDAWREAAPYLTVRQREEEVEATANTMRQLWLLERDK